MAPGNIPNAASAGPGCRLAIGPRRICDLSGHSTPTIARFHQPPVASSVLQQLTEFLNGEARIPEDISQRPRADVTARVHGNGGPPAIRVTHDVVTAIDPANDESHLFQRAHHLPAPHRRNRRHKATSGTVIVNSSGTPNSANQPSSASRRSATASSAVCPSPLAPPPGSEAWADHQPVSSCSTVYGTCTTRSTRKWYPRLTRTAELSARSVQPSGEHASSARAST